MNLIVKNLTKSYEGRTILQDISLDIKKGEVTCLYGFMNVGKSVLIRVIAGMEKSEMGAISFDGKDLTDCDSEERDFYFPNLSNETYWKSVFNDRSRSELGDGEGQVLAIEHAMKTAKGVLLLDNSFCQMDKKTKKLNYDLIRKAVTEKNLAVLFATNDYDEVFQVADRVAVLNGGKIIQEGNPEDIYRSPATKEVAEIFGNNNLMDAKYVGSNKADFPEFITSEGEHKISTAIDENADFAESEVDYTLAIRPENISLSFGASFPEDNLIKATVKEIVFKGSTTAIKLDANGLELEALVLKLVGLNVGDECMVGLPPDRILVLKN